MAIEPTDGMIEHVAKALYEHAVKAAREEFNAKVPGLEDARQFFLKLREESDAALVVLSTSYIDAHLTDSWRRNMAGKSNTAVDALFDNSGPLATMSSKIRLAHALSWISDDLNTDLHTIRKIRNKFAHDPYPSYKYFATTRWKYRRQRLGYAIISARPWSVTKSLFKWLPVLSP